ncbi:quinone oxidoreductase-like [Tropilaelaps mercedesae]|uniref:Quinone oxidoreductase-like n=1 Tax=Tropilaelaps mercedesae TaxID=418985 RepID=A0A1V9Y420_9ACAR|nr:quinone oxidoreductase-like [Tropilaelaps mercedesae]
MAVSSKVVPKTMQAIIVKALGEPDVMKIATIPLPDIDSHQVLVRVEYAGVNPVDTYIRSGAFGKVPALPFTPGKDGSGVVYKIGSSINHLKVGDQVWFCAAVGTPHGSYAEFAVVQGTDTWVLPKGVGLQIGAALGVPYLTAYRALLVKGKCRSGQIVFIHGGSGAVGQACVQIAKKEGLRVVATAGSDTGEEILRGLKVDGVFSHRGKGYVDYIRDKFPEGFDLIVEMRADLNLSSDCVLAGRNGRILVVGNRGPTHTLNARHIMLTEVSIIGVALMASTKAEWEAGAAYVSKGVGEGWLAPRISKEYPLEDAPQAHIDIIEATEGATGKLLLKIYDD